MRALLIEEHGGPEVLRFVTREVPEPKPGQVLVRMEAVGLNHLDLWVRRGVSGHRFPLPIVPGSDGAGRIQALGPGVKGFAVGDRVAISAGFVPEATEESLDGEHALSHGYQIMGETFDGTAAEFVAVATENLLLVPEGMSAVEAASIPLAALTAHHMLVRRGGLRAGHDVLIWGAGSGVSVYAIQLAKLMGARVFAISTKAEKLPRARGLGADEVIDASKEDVLARVRALTQKRGVDLVIDHVGEKTMGISLRCLTKGGAVLTCGATSGPKLEADLRLIFFKSLSIVGSTMGGLGEMRKVWRLVQRGQIKPVIDRVFPFTEAAQAHAHLESGQAFGKVVLSLEA